MYRLKGLGTELEVCTNLKNLKICKSKIRVLPAVMGKLKLLEKLDMHEN
jgi:Leucine-rich repeat (LRR) protein